MARSEFPAPATQHQHHFDDLSPDDFERLVYWLVRRSGEFSEVQWYGGVRDKGRDVVAHKHTGTGRETWYVQCKRYRSIGFSTLRDELDKLAKHARENPGFAPDAIVFATACDVPPDAKDRAGAHARALGLPEPYYWGRLELDERLKDQPRTEKAFFGNWSDRLFSLLFDRHLLSVQITSQTGLIVTLSLCLMLLVATRMILGPFRWPWTPTPTPPSNTRPPPTATFIPPSTVTPTSTPTLLPPVTLIAPEEGACVDCGSEVTFQWSWPHVREADQCYELGLWGAEPLSYTSSYTTTENSLGLSTSHLAPGEYDWAVTVVDREAHKAVSERSESFRLQVIPPAPVVHSISPTNTLKGTPVSVVISGENFTDTAVLTIGVPLSRTVVSSSTITATIPMTLNVGDYPVIVQDSRGRGESYALFTVKEPPPPPSTPRPTPSLYPPPRLTEATPMRCNVMFRWEWDGELAGDEWFAVRVAKLPDEPHSQDWVQEREYLYNMCILGGDEGDYGWRIAICRGDRGQQHCHDLRALSELGVFHFGGCKCE